MDNNGEIRYGVSVLDMQYKNYAQDDEVMIKGQTGQMFYKRSDGQIVTYGSDYNKDSLYSALMNATKLNNHKSDDYLVYHIIDTPSGAYINDTSEVSLNVSKNFPLSSNEAGIYVRVHGNDATNAAMAAARSIYLTKNTLNGENDVQIKGTVNGKAITINCKFNELTFVPIDTTGNPSLVINSISYPVLSKAIASLTPEQFDVVQLLNYGNDKFEATSIDLITFVSDVVSVFNKSDEKVKLGLIDTMVMYGNYTIQDKNIPIILSKEKPNFNCMWAQELDSIPNPK